MFQYYTWAARIYRLFKYLKSLSFIPRCGKKTCENSRDQCDRIFVRSIYIVSRGDFSFKKKRERGGGIKNDRIEFIRLNPRFRGVNQI